MKMPNVIFVWLLEVELLASKRSELSLGGILSIRILVFLQTYVCNRAKHKTFCRNL